mmetsp:Transcript_3315/g.3293  ORF Transcript_3315/g.3293 Transcript_3315/m.3293 type:complete len:167 (+) Transcript_3315:154-654(+)
MNNYPGFKPQEFGFDFAFGLRNSIDPEIGFFTVNKVEYYYLDDLDEKGVRIRKKLKTDIPFDLCGNEHFRFSNQTQVEIIGISNFLCITDRNYTLQGDFYSDIFNYIEIKLKKCVNGTSEVVCQSSEEIDKFFNGDQFSFAFINSLFELDGYQDPISYFIDDGLFF